MLPLAGILSITLKITSSKEVIAIKDGMRVTTRGSGDDLEGTQGRCLEKLGIQCVGTCAPQKQFMFPFLGTVSMDRVTCMFT